MGLQGEYSSGGEYLWSVMMSMDEFSGTFLQAYPPSAETLDALLAEFPTKHWLEVEWAREHGPKIVEKVGEIVPELPTIPLNIISKYTVTWLDV